MKKRFHIRYGRNTVLITVMGIAGVITTGVLSYRAGYRSALDIEELKKDLDREPTVKEKVQKSVKHCIPAGIAVATTITDLVYLHRRNSLTLNRVRNTLQHATKRYEEYTKEVDNHFGEGSAEEVENRIILRKLSDRKPPNGENQLFYIFGHDSFFERSMAEVIDAEYQINRLYVLNGYVSLNDLLVELGLPTTDEASELGWSADVAADIYDKCWLDFDHELITTDDGLECFVIRSRIKPQADYLPF